VDSVGEGAILRNIGSLLSRDSYELRVESIYFCFCFGIFLFLGLYGRSASHILSLKN
jgi:hypothetical protein